MPAPSSQLLKYADEVDVSVANQDVNLVDLDAYGHRVEISVETSAMNGAFSWTRAAGSARPVGHFSDASGALVAALAAAMNTSYTDTDAVTDKLTFDSSALTLNSDARIREGGAVSANDLLMAYVLYKVYGSTTAPTEDVVFNLQDAHGMLSSADYAAAIVAAFNNSESQSNANGNEKGAVDAMFRDLLAGDPLRFFDASGAQVAGLFEVNTDASSSGTWNLVDGDKIEVKTLFTFEHAVTLRTSLDVAQNLGNVATQSNDETVYIAAGSTLSIRLQIAASDSGAGGGGQGQGGQGQGGQGQGGQGQGGQGQGGGGSNLVQIVSFQATGSMASVTIMSPAVLEPGTAPVTSYNIYNNGTLLVSITDAGEVGNFSAMDYTIANLTAGTYNLTITGVNSNGEGLPSPTVSVTVS